MSEEFPHCGEWLEMLQSEPERLGAGFAVALASQEAAQRRHHAHRFPQVWRLLGWPVQPFANPPRQGPTRDARFVVDGLLNALHKLRTEFLPANLHAGSLEHEDPRCPAKSVGHDQPLGRGWPAAALSSAAAGRVRDCFRRHRVYLKVRIRRVLFDAPLRCPFAWPQLSVGLSR